jgi:uncharacterized protein YjlB
MATSQGSRIIVEPPDVTPLPLADDGTFPNSVTRPALLYRQVFALGATEGASEIERVLAANGWSNGWRNGVYPFHHYHSTAHEVLVCYSGSAKLELGGPAGAVVELTRGDAVVISAGVAHKKLESSSDFAVVGCYAQGASYDMKYGRAAERAEACPNIARVPLPNCDPIYGAGGPLLELWKPVL